MHETPQRRTPLEPPPNIKHQADVLADILEGFLGQFLNRNTDSPPAKNTHLHAVIGECAKFGFRLFSEPCAWRFTFDDTRASQQGLAVLPGLEKLGNHEGKLYENPQVIAEPVIVDVDYLKTRTNTSQAAGST